MAEADGGGVAAVLAADADLHARAGAAPPVHGQLHDPADALHIQQAQQVAAGSKGSWDKAVNGQLEPKTAYVLDNGHAYVTDAAGRVKEVGGELSLAKVDRNPYQQCATGKYGEMGDEGGHLIAASLGGAGDRINLVPQASTLNRGDWRDMERD